MDLIRLRVPAWEGTEGLVHGFLGRRGGKSAGPYASLNLSFRVGDDPQVVKDNLCDAKKAVGLHELRVVTMKQVHGDRIIEVKDRALKEAGEADGMIAAEKGIFLGVLTADCVPILFSVPGDGKLAAVAHAGWRGTLAGIAAKMVNTLKEQYGVVPDSIAAALGPTIGPCCYEIGPDVSTPMVAKWGGAAANSLRRADGKTFLDLKSLNRRILENAGIPARQIFEIGPCTSCAAEEFFSYRRDGERTGRQMSVIGWM
jgi:YfiH family protein